MFDFAYFETFSGDTETQRGTTIQEVKSVAKDGSYMVSEITNQNLSAQTSNQTFDADGRLRDILGETNSDEWRLSYALDVVHPSKPVKGGDSWTSILEHDKQERFVAAKASFVALDLQRQDSHDSLKIGMTYLETEGDHPLAANGHVWIDTHDGSIVAMEVSAVNVPYGNQICALQVSMHRK